MIDHILLFGSSGMLGRYIYTYFKDHPIIRLSIVEPNEFRVTQESLETLDTLLETKHVDASTCIINCIGTIPQRSKGDEGQYYLVNTLFPHRLWAAAKHLGVAMIHPTTDCVFSGIKGSYNETDCHDEKGAYGLSKSLGEPLGCTVIRTSIIGNEIQNKKSLLEWIISNNNGSINGYTNHMWNGITCLEYCKVIEILLRRNMLWKGVRHIASPTAKSKYELATLIRDSYNLSITITPIATAIPVDKTLLTAYSLNTELEIPELENQIKELKHYLL